MVEPCALYRHSQRERYLLQRLSLHREPAAKFVRHFLRPPLYSTHFSYGFERSTPRPISPAAARLNCTGPARTGRSAQGSEPGQRRIVAPVETPV
ncbi:MAG: hypothetical protein R3D84_07960 [Paracoccaceae bacterium]